MGIKKVQVSRKLEEIIKNYLYRGRYPTFQTITRHFSDWLQGKTPGMPDFVAKPVMRKEKTDSSLYNEQIASLDQDMQDAFTVTIDQTNQLLADFSFMESERGKIAHELASLSTMIDELLLLSSTTDGRYIDSKVLSFENASNILQEKSTIFVNLPNKEVTLQENKSATKLVALDAKQARFLPVNSTLRHQSIQPIAYALDDQLNTAWWQIVQTKETNAPIMAHLWVPFQQTALMTTVTYVPHHGQAMKVQLEYTPDGATYLPIHEQAEIDQVTQTKTWSFHEREAKGIRFVLEKSAVDERANDWFHYYFGAKQIQVFQKSYLSEGILYTNPIEFNQLVQKVAIDVEQTTPLHTDVRYELAVYKEQTPLEQLIWYPISSYEDDKAAYAKIVHVQTNEIKKVEFPKAEATSETIQGVHVFRLIQEDKTAVFSELAYNSTKKEAENFDAPKNPQLFRGINQWRRERTYVPFTGNIPLASHWDTHYTQQADTIRMDFFNKSNTLPLNRINGGFDDNFYRFTICVHADENRTQPLSLSVMHSLSTGARKRLGVYSVYVNKQRLVPVNEEVGLPLIKGWNEIQILYHFGDVANRRDIARVNLPQETRIGKFSIAGEKFVRAEREPLMYVEPTQLFHNVSVNHKNFFSIYERQVVLTYLPEQTLFQLVYEITPFASSTKQVVMRAHVKRDADVPHVTPRIYKIRLRGM